jgi:hypothetical protein
MKTIKELSTSQKLELKNLLELKLKLVIKEIETDKIEKVELTSRQLQFRRDDALPLCKKYSNKKYENYKNEILAEITNKFENCKKSKNKTDCILQLKSVPLLQLKSVPLRMT